MGLIPKIIHQVWYNRYHDIPKAYSSFSRQMEQLNPGWQYILWTREKALETFGDALFQEWDSLNLSHPSSPVVISERIRLLALQEFGGIYADIDAQPIQSFDKLLPKIKEETTFFGGIKNRDDVADKTLIDCALVGATKGSAVVKELLKMQEVDTFERLSWCVQFSDRLYELMPQLPNQIQTFPEEYFYSREVTENAVILHEPHRMWSWHDGEPEKIDK